MSTTQPRAILVDSSSFLHRNFHAMKPVVSSWEDHPIDVGAVKGYMEYVARELYGPYRTLEADLVIHALDSDGSDYRRQLHPAYKATRPPKHPALIAQESMMGRSLAALGEHVLQRRGVEADDLITSVTKQLVAMGYLVCIVTGDKDLMQLVQDDHVLVARYERDNSGYNKHAFYYEETVFQKMKVYPHQVAAFLAMQGDDVDNIPGIAGVGKVKAAQLLAEFGSLEALMTRSAEIKGKLGEHFRAAQADGSLALCYKLTLPLDDLDVGLDRFLQKPLQNETDAQFWHALLKLDSKYPLRLSDFGSGAGYVASAPAPAAPAPAPAAAPVPAPVAAAPAPVVAAPAPAAPAPARSVAVDPFAGNGEDVFGENLDQLADTLTQTFVSPPPRVAPEAPAAAPAPEATSADPSDRRRFTRRPR